MCKKITKVKSVLWHVLQCLLICLIIHGIIEYNRLVITDETQTSSDKQDKVMEPRQDDLWNAICFVESTNNPHAYKKDEQAAGIGQIRPICLDDCNRILILTNQDRDKFTLDDRWDPDTSREMFDLYTEYYYKRYEKEIKARIWKGGPRGWENKNTFYYWQRVKKEMNK